MKDHGFNTQISPEDAIIQMIQDHFACISFDLDGTILRANANFLGLMGYREDEVIGRHHRMFVAEEYAASEAYQTFWQDLAAGKSYSTQFPRITKSGETVWIQATYAAVRDSTGEVCQVVKVATDVTHRRVIIEQVSAGLDRAAHGDLSFRAKADPSAELFGLAESFNQSMHSLSQVISVASDVAGGLDRSARSLRESADHAVTATRENASAIEAAARDVSSASASIASTSDAASASRDFATSAVDLAANAVEDMGQAMEVTMDMRRAVDKMAGINKAMESIAFQTNMLALNAGVEAARAGQAGAGFAVVAGEIRSLASRSNDASREIYQLIDMAVNQSNRTEKHVKSSEGRMTELRSATDALAEKLNTISEAATDQTERLNEIDAGVRHLARSAQKDVQAAETNSRSAQQLENLGRQLSSELSRFS